MWEISEGDTKFIYTMKLVPPKEPRSFVHPGTIHSSTIHSKYWHLALFSQLYLLDTVCLELFARHYSLASMCFHINLFDHSINKHL